MLKTVATFLLGQGIVQILSLTVGIALARILPVEQYALYTIAGSLIAFVSIGSNFGLSQGIISQGAPHRDDGNYVGSLLSAARKMSRRLLIVAVVCMLFIAAWMLQRQSWPLESKVGCVVLVTFIGWTQVGSSLGRAVLNIHHDSYGISRVGLAEALVRITLLPLCFFWPYASTALGATLAAGITATLCTSKRCSLFCNTDSSASYKHFEQLHSFVWPIAPILIYTLIQGQISVLLLSYFADARSIAETGVLGRLGQIFTVLTLLNPFLVQPVFARINSRDDMGRKLIVLIVSLAAICIVIMSSSFFIPKLWLVLLGDNYRSLTNELPIAVGTSLATFVGGTIYTLVIAIGRTTWQSLTIVPCAGAQGAFIWLHGVRTTADALILNLVPVLIYAIMQVGFLILALSEWRRIRCSA